MDGSRIRFLVIVIQIRSAHKSTSDAVKVKLFENFKLATSTRRNLTKGFIFINIQLHISCGSKRFVRKQQDCRERWIRRINVLFAYVGFIYLFAFIPLSIKLLVKYITCVMFALKYY